MSAGRPGDNDMDSNQSTANDSQGLDPLKQHIMAVQVASRLSMCVDFEQEAEPSPTSPTEVDTKATQMRENAAVHMVQRRVSSEDFSLEDL
mmetsp:Transcript_31536/g.68959  ORF Transcript_31536/g.68959 Transcript_31536/m.68959 type:complete len:91 (+) Transcript_31536:113-385(+)